MKLKSGPTRDAVELGDVAKLTPPARAALQIALGALRRGDYAEAERALTTCFVYAPSHPEPHRLLGIVLQRLGRPTHAIASFHQALALRPDDAGLLASLAQVQTDAGDISTAIDTARALVARREDAGTLFLLASLLDRHGEIAAALAVLERALAIDPDHAKARGIYARALFHSGRLAEAEAQFRSLLRARQEVGAAWHGLAEMRTVKFGVEDVAALKTLCAKPQLPPLELAALKHVLGRALEDAGDYSAAFAEYNEAARLERGRFPWNAAAFESYVSGIRAAFPLTLATADANFGHEVIFIVGMPRSGSTLIEQILAAHDQVEGASELPDLQAVIQEESTRRNAPLAQWASRATPADWRRLGEIYLARTQRWRAHKPRLTDKMPGNWLFAEAALAMLPGARIIDCRRDALETCWSCFKQFFAPGLVPWSSEFADLARYWRASCRHGDHLALRYPDRFRIQRYEDLLDNAEMQICALLRFCGLPFDPACLRFHESARTIRTASAAQVRQPLHRAASNADLYGVLLDPLREALVLASASD